MRRAKVEGPSQNLVIPGKYTVKRAKTIGTDPSSSLEYTFVYHISDCFLICKQLYYKPNTYDIDLLLEKI